VDVELLEYVLDMVSYGGAADGEAVRDRCGGGAFFHEPEDLELSTRQLPRGRLIDPRRRCRRLLLDVALDLVGRRQVPEQKNP